MNKKVLLAGESWMSYTTHVKGFDSFYTSSSVVYALITCGSMISPMSAA